MMQVRNIIWKKPCSRLSATSPLDVKAVLSSNADKEAHGCLTDSLRPCGRQRCFQDVLVWFGPVTTAMRSLKSSTESDVASAIAIIAATASLSPSSVAIETRLTEVAMQTEASLSGLPFCWRLQAAFKVKVSLAWPCIRGCGRPAGCRLPRGRHDGVIAPAS